MICRFIIFLNQQTNIVMNVARVLLAGIAVTSFLAPMAALACEESSTYQGGGYTVTIGSEGSYYGCNAKKQCLEIANYAHQTQGQYIWENKGFTYSMTPVANGNYRLKVMNDRNRVVLNKIVKPTV
jgi:hypothetical protein